MAPPAFTTKKNVLKKLFRGLIFALLLLFVGAGLFFYFHSFHKEWPRKGILAEDQLFPASPETAYKNLDLKIAAKYRFTSDSIKKVQSLGVENGSGIFIVSFKVPADNLTEYGLMSVPTSPQPAKGYPVIILCHGYTKPSRYSTTKYYLSDMEEYSANGFVVIKPDFRGQGLSLYVGQPEGAYYSMAYNTDLLSLIAAVKKTNYLNSANINLWGHSLGAYIALRAAVLSPDIKNVILLSGPVGSASDMFIDFTPISDRTNPVAENIRKAMLLRYRTPLSNPQFWDATSPLSYLNQLKAYVQIHVGSNDVIVPPRFSADLDKALTAAKKPHDYFIYPGGSHGLVDERPQIYARSLQLLKSRL